MGPATTSAAAAAAAVFLRGVSSARSSSSSWSSLFWASKMPRVDADLKLDFKDVLFRPKRSSLKSRSEVGELNYFHSDNVIRVLQLKMIYVQFPPEKDSSQDECNLFCAAFREHTYAYTFTMSDAMVINYRCMEMDDRRCSILRPYSPVCYSHITMIKCAGWKYSQEYLL